jgi:hypothetical protein
MKHFVGLGLAMSAVCLLAGCSAVNSLPGVHLGGSGDGGTASTSPTDTSTSLKPATDTLSCIGGVITITMANSTDTIEGTCPQVIIAGSNITLTSEGINRLIISGSNDTVTATQIGALTVAGHADVVKAAGFGPVNISGSGCTITSTGTIAALVISGSDNRITAPKTITSVIQSGTGNTIGKG